QVAVLPIDGPAFAAAFPAGRVPRLLDGLVGAPARPAEARGAGEVRARFVAAAPAQRPAILQAFLVDRVAAAMHSAPEDLPIDRNLVELGMDSLMAMDVANHLKRELHLTLYPRELYEHPSVGALSRYLAAELERALALEAAPGAPPVAAATADAAPLPTL